MKNKKYFKRNKLSSQYNSRLYSFGGIWDNYGEGYKQAIELIEREVLENNRTYQDFLIYPYCFLMRHFIEIRLKEVIYEGTKKLNGEPEIKEGHNLPHLWDKAQKILKELWKEHYEEAHKDILSFINDFNSLDNKSDGFRYPFDTNGNKNLTEINGKEINFKNLSEVFRQVREYLNGVTDSLVSIE